MSFWKLETDDLQKETYLFPFVLSFRKVAKWDEVLHMPRPKLVIMAVTSLPFSVIILLSGISFVWLTGVLEARTHSPKGKLGGLLYLALGLFILYVGIRVLQSSVRLTRHLRDGEPKA